jgi:hypothetical protein
VRCDDPQKLCQCSPTGSSNTIAYTTNKDADSGLARINFCPLYFLQPSLLEVIVDGHGERDPRKKWSMETYQGNKGKNARLSNDIRAFAKKSIGRTWFHELMHIDWVAQARQYGVNQHVTDLTLLFNRQGGGQTRAAAYGSIFTKALGRYATATGAWVIQNADNLALFALAKVMQNELGAYPHYPIVYRPPDGAPERFLFEVDSSWKVTFNDTDPLPSGSGSTCDSNEDADNPPVSLTVDTWAPDSAYPAEWLVEEGQWAANYSSSGSGSAVDAGTSAVDAAKSAIDALTSAANAATSAAATAGPSPTLALSLAASILSV